jgi:predicted nucleic acid-binding protein
MYEVLNEAFPSHGLEIVFVSSDRNPAEFEQYFSTMPWLAIPGFHNQLLSAMYQVQGIPSLVILDAVSGQVVVPNNVARKEVHQACQSGEYSICDMFRGWLQAVPAETIELLSLLEASCEPIVAEELLIPETYLTSAEYQSRRHARESLISELMEEGLDRGEANEAARAVERVSTDDNDDASMGDSYEPGSLNGGFIVQVLSIQNKQERTAIARGLANKIHDPASIIESLETARKYLSNCIKAPHSTRFRKIDLSFKVVDAKIGQVVGGVEVLEALGFRNELYGDTYMLYIPVHADLHRLEKDIGLVMEELRKM